MTESEQGAQEQEAPEKCACCEQRPADPDVAMTVTVPSTRGTIKVPLCMPCAEAYMRETVGTPGSSLTLDYGDEEGGE